MHGELQRSVNIYSIGDGSSPRAWGTLYYATEPRTRNPVHPHVHGELIPVILPAVLPNGSSPRAWGTLSLGRVDAAGSRFIPTCMGNSCVTSCHCGFLPVHPHVHGELLYQPFQAVTLFGSSPRAWGTRLQAGEGRRGARFIPTCMGNSPRPPVGEQGDTVHPHVHGELISHP